MWTHGVRRMSASCPTITLRRGFASAMLCVLVGNARAIRFYENDGFSTDIGSTQRFAIGGREVRELRCPTSL